MATAGGHRLHSLERDASPQLGFEAPAGFVHAEVAQRLGAAEVLVHHAQQAWEFFWNCRCGTLGWACSFLPTQR